MSDKITSKPKYKVITSESQLDYSDDTKVLQSKYDGAHSIFELNADKPNKIYSYRVSKKTGNNIDHSDQVPAIRDLTIPDIFNKTILRGELYAKTDHKPLPAEQIGGILNSSVEKSIAKQKEKGWLIPYIFDIAKFHGQNVANDPYKTKLSLIQRISDALPELHTAETAFTPEQKKALVDKIKSGNHPDTKEGVVQWDLNKPSGNPSKLKFRDNFEVYVRDIFPAVDKNGKEKNEAGGFSFSWKPTSKIVGTVGTGFSKDKRIDMLKNPDNYIGTVARVKSSQKYESGALRAPSFYSMHVEKNLDKLASIKLSKFIGELFPHQEDVVNKLKDTNAILVYHGLGAGKTGTSIAASEGDNTDVVVPASLRGNYEKELKKFTTDRKNRNLMSYHKFMKDGPSLKSNTLVLDEPQKVGRTSSQMSQAVVDLSRQYDKRILLTGTPASNHPSELAPIIRILSPEARNIPLNPTDFNRKFLGENTVSPGFFKRLIGVTPGVEYYPRNVDEIKNAIKNKVSYYETEKKDYPERVDEIKKVEASKEQLHYYSYVTNNANPIIAMKIKMNLPLSKAESTQLNAFMTAARQVSNSTTSYGGTEGLSPKLKTAVDDFSNHLKNNENHKGLIYSNYIESGLDPVSEELDRRGIPNAKFVGGLTDSKRKKIVDDYNSGKTKALLVSSAGAEGLDLKGTRTIQILEPHWNKNRIEQVIGRGIRYKSHEGLPDEEKKVKVIKYETIVPKTLIQKILGRDRSTSTDEYLEDLSNKKQKTLDQFLKIFKDEGMPKMDMEQIKQAAFIDELKKIALHKEMIAPVLSGMAGGLSSAIAYTLVDKSKKKKDKTITVELSDPRLYDKIKSISREQ
jgi:superfamily II DNA or RNA helicase